VAFDLCGLCALARKNDLVLNAPLHLRMKEENYECRESREWGDEIGNWKLEIGAVFRNLPLIFRLRSSLRLGGL
jgi:hypothetical protein